jgi:hypothetical protein
MKLAIALTLLSTTHSQEYARINKLRGVDLGSSPKKIKLTNNRIDASNAIHLDAATKLELALHKIKVGDDAADLAACAAHTTVDECSGTCSWCDSKAVSSACYPTEMTGRLPAGVFECATKEEREEVVTSRLERLVDRLEDLKKKDEKVVRSEFFNLKEGITLTLTSDAVDKEFCDPNSDVSLAGYMNGESREVGDLKIRLFLIASDLWGVHIKSLCAIVS